MEDVHDFNFNARHRVPHIEKLLCLREVDVGQRRVVFVHAGLEQRNQHEGADFRYHTHCTDRAGWRGHHVDRITDKDAEPHREFLTQNDTGFFRLDWRAIGIIGRRLFHLDRLAEVR